MPKKSKSQKSADDKVSAAAVITTECDGMDPTIAHSDTNTETLEQPSLWDLIKILDKTCRDVCRMEGCNRTAMVVWAENLNPTDTWPLCEECQEHEFGGWPVDVKPPPNEDSKPKKKRSKSNQGDMPDTLSTDPGATSPAPPSEDEDEEKEVWDLKKILSIAEITECPIKCSSDACTLPAACAWVSNLNPTKWYSCLDCQAKDFGGWPPVEEFPVPRLEQDHLDILAKKCSRKHDIEMPVFDAASPNKGEEIGAELTHTVTPFPGTTQLASDGNETFITPAPAQPAKAAPAKKINPPSKQVLAMHRKWQEAAEAAGGKDARLVVSKPAAKKLIFDLLSESFRPMTITDIHRALKSVVPSPVLKECLDEMALTKDTGDVFVDSDDEEKQAKPKKADSNDPYAGSLVFKSAKVANASIYYVDYSKTKNNGNGLEPHARNELAAALANARAEEEALKDQIKQANALATQLHSEPTNEEAVKHLEVEEASLAELQAQVEEARKLRVNEKEKLQLKRRIEAMAAHWRDRRRICMDFLISMEETTEGTISVKKCLAGDGQIDIESDEVVAKNAVEYAKKKRSSHATSTVRGLVRPAKKAKLTENSTSLADESFVAVLLDSQGTVKRVYVDAE